MRKLIEGIIEFRKKYLPQYVENYSHLAFGQSPDALFIMCSDSRVDPSLFASTNPGDIFAIRNVGNIVPAHQSSMQSIAEASAIEFSLTNLAISDIIVCGHSDCAAMQALVSGVDKVQSPHLQEWLKNCGCCINDIKDNSSIDKQLLSHNQLAQVNILQQIKNLKTYPLIVKKINEGKLQIHGWYFDIGKGDVYCFEEQFNQFVLINEDEAERILKRLK